MSEQDYKQQADKIVEMIKELVKDGSASRVILKRKGETLLNISLNTGIIGAVAGLAMAPFAVLTAALVSFGLDCEIEIEKKDGTVINLSETEFGTKLENIKNSAFDMAKGAFEKSKNEKTVDFEDVEEEKDTDE